MKFTLSWLKDHLETEATLDEITYALTDLGLEVEEVVDRAARLRPFTLAKVLHAERHPDADKLRVCRVLTEEGEKQIVCGAPNARAGITVVLCKPGDYVPGIDVTLGVGRIRGVESHGMMASERELELSDEHIGIIELPSGEVGERFVDWLAAHRPETVDAMIHIKITPNRPDALGVRGIARDLAARALRALSRSAPDRDGGSDDPRQEHPDPPRCARRPRHRRRPGRARARAAEAAGGAAGQGRLRQPHRGQDRREPEGEGLPALRRP